jgi:hypothetical protein
MTILGGRVIRLKRLVPVVIILYLSQPVFAQGWMAYVSSEDRFSVNLPGVPEVRDITYPSEYGAVFPGRVYSLENGPSRYSVTVIDYRDAERIHAERTNKTEADSMPIYWQIDVQASIAYAAWHFRQRDAEVTYDAWHYIDLIEGHQLQLTNADQSRTFAAIYLHESLLYILEATVPPRAPPPGLFQQSLSLLDEEGNRVRYESIYSNQFPPSSR